MAMTFEKFPLPYRFTMNSTISYATREVVFESQRKQTQQLAIVGIQDWSVEVAGDMKQYKLLQDFFRKMGGNTRLFIFFDEYNKPKLVRFSSNKLNLQVKRDWNHGSPTNGFSVGFTGTVQVETALDVFDGVNPNVEADKGYVAFWDNQFGNTDWRTT